MTEPATPDAKEPAPSLPLNVKVVGLASLLNDIATEMIFPLMPGFLLGLVGGDKFWLGIIEGVADTLASFLKLWFGAVSDQPGRRKSIVVIGYLLSALSRPFLAVIGAPWQLLAIRLADRFGKGVRTAPRDALIADSTDPSIRGRAFGFHRAMDHVGAAVGPLIAAGLLWLWGNDGIRTIFALTIVPGLAVVVLLIFGLRQTKPTTPQPTTVAAPRLSAYPFDRNFTIYLIALIVFTLGNSSDAFLLVRAKELGVPTIWLPILWCVFHVVKSAGNLVMGRAVDRHGPKPFMFIGWFIYGAVYLAFGFADAAWQVWVLFLGYAVFYACTEPAEKTLVAILVGSERKGLAYGWYNFALGIATLPASVLFGLLYQQFGPETAFGMSAGLALASGLMLMLVRGTRTGSQAPAFRQGSRR